MHSAHVRVMYRCYQSLFYCAVGLLIGYGFCINLRTQCLPTIYDQDSLELPKRISIKEVHQDVREYFSTSDAPTTSNLDIMILSSTPRSGSTLISELLTTYSNDIKFYFEPDQYIQNIGCLNSTSCTLHFFSNLLSCKEDSDFVLWFKKKKFFFKYYDMYANLCHNGTDYQACVEEINIIKDCKRSSTIKLIKNVRVRLGVFNQLLKKYKHLKIIHLYRDPRGSNWSIKRFKWNTTVEEHCENLLDDLYSYDELKKKFPDRIINLSYEFFCQYPMEETLRLFSFLFKAKTLPISTEKYISKHILTEENVKGAMSTTKNAKNYYQSWRWKISDSYLKGVESINECRLSITKLGHNLFGSLHDAQNVNISLFINMILL